MTIATPEQCKAAALKVANKMRRLLNLPPVESLYPGDVGLGDSCAISATVFDDDLDRSKWRISTSGGHLRAYAIDDKTYSLYISQPKHEIKMKNTPGAASFVHRFDNREFPELIKPK